MPHLSHPRPAGVALSFLAAAAVTAWVGGFAAPVSAQKKKAKGDLRPPEPGYVFPAGGKAGTTVNVHLAGLDWTPDLQYFVLDSAVALKPTGEPGPVMVPPPPYWFGAKSTLTPLPLQREQPATIVIPANTPPGPVRWAVAGASGVGAKTGIFWVGDGPEVLEQPAGKTPQKLASLPVTVNGRLSRIEEVDRYAFTAAKAGPVTVEFFGRRLGVNVNAQLTVGGPNGRVVADAVDTDGTDLAVTFPADAGTEYLVTVNDLDFRGDYSFVYRLAVTAGPRVVATVPAAGKRGETRDVEFVGYGVATGKDALESVTKKVTFPADAKVSALAYRLETPHGIAPLFNIPLSNTAETVAARGETPLTLPAAVTGVFDGATEAKFKLDGKKGDVWELAADARRFGSPVDASLAVVGPDGKELARNDDVPGTTDAALSYTVPADGTYTLVVSDLSGKPGGRAAVFRLSADKPAADFTLASLARFNVPLGGSADVVVKAVRKGGFKEPIALKFSGLPAGVTAPADLVIPGDKPELKVTLTAAEDAAAVAAAFTVTGTAGGLTRPALAPAPGNQAVRSAADEQTPTLLLATTLAPRVKLVAVEADGGRKVHRGSTHPAEVTVERLNDFAGEVSLQMASNQSYQRQGITGPDMVVPADATRAFYPCFMPEWLESTRTSRMELVGVVKVPDPKGTVRYLVTPMSGRITMSIEGAILKVDAPREVKLKPGETVTVPVSVLQSTKLNESVRLEVKVPDELAKVLTAEPVTVAAGQAGAAVKLTCAAGAKVDGEYPVTVRGTAFQGGKYAVVSEAAVAVEVVAK